MRSLFKRRPKLKRERTISVVREYFELIVEVLVFVFFINTFLLQSFVIPTGSMEDTLLIGDHLLVSKVAYSRSLSGLERRLLPQIPLRRGLVVTFKAPPNPDDPEEDRALLSLYRDWAASGNPSDKAPYPPSAKEYVKRIIGLPGEAIRIEDKKVFINGTRLAEPYAFFKVSDASRDGSAVFPPDAWFSGSGYFPPRFRAALVMTEQGKAFKIPDGYYFCMGDNRDNSFDCRYWGPVPADYIIGKPWRIYWSYDSDSAEYLAPGFIHKIRDLALTGVRFFTRTRWQRSGKPIR
jgi:signal peptidase I